MSEERLFWPCLGPALVGLCLRRCERVSWKDVPPWLVVAEVSTDDELRRILALVRAAQVAALLLVPAALAGPELPDAADRWSRVRVVVWSRGEDRGRVAVRAGQALVGLVVSLLLRERYDFWMDRFAQLHKAINGADRPPELPTFARCTPLATYVWMHACALAGGLVFKGSGGLAKELGVHRNTVHRKLMELPPALAQAFLAPGAFEAAPAPGGTVEGLKRSADEAAVVLGGLTGLRAVFDDARVGARGLAREVLELALMREARDGTESLEEAAKRLAIDESCFGRL